MEQQDVRDLMRAARLILRNQMLIMASIGHNRTTTVDVVLRRQVESTSKFIDNVLPDSRILPNGGGVG